MTNIKTNYIAELTLTGYTRQPVAVAAGAGKDTDKDTDTDIEVQVFIPYLTSRDRDIRALEESIFRAHNYHITNNGRAWVKYRMVKTANLEHNNPLKLFEKLIEEIREEGIATKVISLVDPKQVIRLLQ